MPEEHQHACPVCGVSYGCANTGCDDIKSIICVECDPIGG